MISSFVKPLVLVVPPRGAPVAAVSVAVDWVLIATVASLVAQKITDGMGWGWGQLTAF